MNLNKKFDYCYNLFFKIINIRMYTLLFPIPSYLNTVKISSILDYITKHPDITDCSFEVQPVKNELRIIADDFYSISRAYNFIINFKFIDNNEFK